MFEQHYQLSCFVLEKVSRVTYSSFGDTVGVIDEQGSVFEFRLPHTEHYQKVVSEQPLRTVKRIGHFWISLDAQNVLVVRQDTQELYRFTSVLDISFLACDETVAVLGLSLDPKNLNGNSILVGSIPLKTSGKACFQSIPVSNKILQQSERISKIVGNCMVASQENGNQSLLRLNPNSIDLRKSNIDCIRLKFELNLDSSIISHFSQGLLVRQNQKTYYLNSHSQIITELKDFPSHTSNVTFLPFQDFLIALISDKIWIYETVEGTLMSQVSVGMVLLGADDGSSVTLFAHQGERYSLVYDQCSPSKQWFFLFDKERLSFYRIRVPILLERGFVGAVKESLELVAQDADSIHENVMKTANFRLKKMSSLDGYIREALEGGSYRNSLRFLANEQNIFVMNDGMMMLHLSLMGHLEKISKSDATELEKEVSGICKRLISQSKYEHHISNGLSILNWCYSTFQKKAITPASNKACYEKILDLPRIKRFLSQSSVGKKRQLIELCLELSLKVRGYESLQALE